MRKCDSFDHGSLPKEENLSSDDGLFLRRCLSPVAMFVVVLPAWQEPP